MYTAFMLSIILIWYRYCLQAIISHVVYSDEEDFAGTASASELSASRSPMSWSTTVHTIDTTAGTAVTGTDTGTVLITL